MPPSLYVENPFSFQGEIYIALLDATTKLPGSFWWIGNCPKAEFKPKIERRQKKESWSGKRQISRTAVKSREASLDMTIEDLNKHNVKVGLLGNLVTTAGGAITNETHGSLLEVGSVVKLKNPNASSIVVTDSAGSPATLVANTDYKVLDADHGLIEILSLGSYTQPFKFAYTSAATLVITGMEADDSNEYAIYCKLINTEDTPDQATALEIYRVQIDPTQLLALMNEDDGSFDISALVLRHNTNANDSERGGYFRWIYTDANN
jgi:hypothetical protein